MSFVAVFARYRHPLGWGSNHDTSSVGYSLIFVEGSKDQIERIRMLMPMKEFHGIDKETAKKKNWANAHMGEWFGGYFEFVGQFFTDDTGAWDTGLRFNSFGEHRYIGYFTAEEVLLQLA